MRRGGQGSRGGYNADSKAHSLWVRAYEGGGGWSSIFFSSKQQWYGVKVHEWASVTSPPLLSPQAMARMREEDKEENPLDYVDYVRKELKLEAMILDLSSFRSTRQFVNEFKSKGLPLHILVNNAGVGLVTKGEGR